MILALVEALKDPRKPKYWGLFANFLLKYWAEFAGAKYFLVVSASRCLSLAPQRSVP